MKKPITFLSLVTILILVTSAVVQKQSTGIAGYTGSPGEAYCTDCHGGGSSASSGITITAVPSFINDEYVPSTTYTITVSAQADGFSKYGFACEILDDNNSSVGTMQTIAGAGVKFLNAGNGRRNAVHSTAKSAATANFSFRWVAPDEGSGNVTFYASANAVNGNGQTTGDFPITPVSMSIFEGAPPLIDGINENSIFVSQVSVYPNPITGFATLSYSLQKSGEVAIELIEMNGKLVKQLFKEKQQPDEHSKILDLQTIPAGIYFIKVSFNNQKIAQKMVVVK